MDLATFQLLNVGGIGGHAPTGRRRGVPRPNGRCIQDDDGEFYPLGLTFFWSMQGLKYEPEHYESNLAWASDEGFDFVRIITEVDWAGNRRIDPTQPEWSDWHAILRGVLDMAYDEYGLRTEITLSGKGTSTDLLWLAREAGAIVEDGRAHKVIAIEMQNERSVGNGASMETLEAMVGEIGGPNMCMLSCPDDGSEAAGQRMFAASVNAGVPVMTRHTERSGADYGWRDVRQAYDFHLDVPLVGWNGEPPGPGSSGSTNTNPLQLAMMRALSIMCGAAFVQHTGTGVYGDGKAHPTAGPRPANFWEIDNINAIVSAVRGVASILPAGLPNWTVANTGWQPPLPVAPFQANAYWEGDHGDGVNKAYSALAPDGRWIQMPCGVRGHVTLTASYPLRDVVVYDPIALRPVASFEAISQGASIQLPGGGQGANVAYIIQGRR